MGKTATAKLLKRAEKAGLVEKPAMKRKSAARGSGVRGKTAGASTTLADKKTSEQFPKALRELVQANGGATFGERPSAASPAAPTATVQAKTTTAAETTETAGELEVRASRPARKKSGGKNAWRRRVLPERAFLVSAVQEVVSRTAPPQGG